MRAKLVERDARNEALYRINDELRKQNEELRKQVTLLRREFQRLLRGRGGAHLIDEGQGTLFGADLPTPVAEPEPAPEHVHEAPDGETQDDPIKKRHMPKKRARKVDSSALPRAQVFHEIPEGERICPITGVALVPIGEKVFEEIDYTPAQLSVIEHHQVKYGPAPEVALERQIATVVAPMPPRALEDCTASAGLLAQILVQKYEYHRVPRRRTQLPKGVRPKARRSESCCTEDEGRPFEIGVQAQVSNRLELRGSRARVVSVEGNGVVRPRQVRSKETNASEPLMTCREVFTRRRNRAGWLARDKSRGHLSTDWMASGMKAA